MFGFIMIVYYTFYYYNYLSITCIITNLALTKKLIKEIWQKITLAAIVYCLLILKTSVI